MAVLTASKRDIRDTLREVAEFFGVAVVTVKSWRAEVEPMPGEPGSYNLSEIYQWLANKRKGDGGLSEELKRADIRLKTIQAQQRELEWEIEKGKLVGLDDVERWAAIALIESREMLMALPEVLATSSPPDLREFVREETDRHVRDVLTMLRRKLETEQIEGEGDGSNSTAV